MVFLDREITAAARTFDGEATEVLTYFVNRIRHADRATPYSMVASMYAAPICSTIPTGRYPEAKSDGIILNDWTADAYWRGSIVVAPQDRQTAASEIRQVGQDGRFVQVLLLVRSEVPYDRRQFHPITPCGWPSSYIEYHTGIT